MWCSARGRARQHGQALFRMSPFTKLPVQLAPRCCGGQCRWSRCIRRVGTGQYFWFGRTFESTAHRIASALSYSRRSRCEVCRLRISKKFSGIERNRQCMIGFAGMPRPIVAFGLISLLAHAEAARGGGGARGADRGGEGGEGEGAARGARPAAAARGGAEGDAAGLRRGVGERVRRVERGGHLPRARLERL